jgi:nucleoside-diphosphate-sugar epimerase
VIFGCGFTGLIAARQWQRFGGQVVATTRDAQRAKHLSAEGFLAHAAPTITEQWVKENVIAGDYVLATLPPDGSTDETITTHLPDVRSVYISTTGVYGDRRGVIDDSTPVDPVSDKIVARLAAEECWRARGATVMRAAGIYGHFRGLHRRVLDGTARIVDDGSRVVSRIHVEDLAMLCVRALMLDVRGKTFPVGDDTPVGQGEVLTWLAKVLEMPVPARVTAAEVAETLRHDRAVDSGPVKRALDTMLRYPSYREGFTRCLAGEGIIVR